MTSTRYNRKKKVPLRAYVGHFNKKKVYISAFKRNLIHDGGMYKEVTKYRCRTMEDVLSKAWTQIKWEEDSTYRRWHSPGFESLVVRNERTKRDAKPYQRPQSGNTSNISDNGDTHRQLFRTESEKH